MVFCDKDRVRETLKDKIVCIVGSGPGTLSNKPGFVDSHEVTIRVNNYKLMGNTGKRTDVFYSFFGGSIKIQSQALKQDGVKLCMAKCPDAQFMESEWHRKNHKMNGVDFRPIYQARKSWWFCDTYVPTTEEFIKTFELLGKHIPTTGFAALIDVLSYEPKSVFLTGFDGFSSKIHNVNEVWMQGDKNDPICHRPELEMDWLRENRSRFPISFDKKLRQTLA